MSVWWVTYEKSEADVRHELISPLLKRVARSMSEIVLPATNPEEQEYASSLVVESTTERRLHPRVEADSRLLPCWTDRETNPVESTSGGEKIVHIG
jgi:hypothetical protein